MSAKTPAEELAAIRKNIAAAKREETSLIWKLPKEERSLDYTRRQARVLRGSTEVSVDYELNKDDLESLGYHHEDDCTAGPHPEVADDRQKLADWHDSTHGLTLWASCVYAPCNILTDEFRSS